MKIAQTISAAEKRRTMYAYRNEPIDPAALDLPPTEPTVIPAYPMDAER